MNDIARLREARPDDDQLRPIPEWEYERAPPDRVFMVGGAWPQATVGLLSGEGGIGKSILCMQMCAAAVMGRAWLGMPCTKGNALMFACEDDHGELLRRQRYIENHMGISHADLEGGLHLIPRVGCDNALCALDKKTWTVRPTPLCSRMLQYCLQHGISYVVVDTATQCMAFNQLDEQQVQQGINVLRRMAVALQGCVILTKHPSMSGRANGTGESGSVQWNNAVRSRLYMRETAADGLILSGMKANYGPKLEKIRLKWQRGVFIQDSPEPVRHWLDRED